jgi:hypothetical protein
VPIAIHGAVEEFEVNGVKAVAVRPVLECIPLTLEFTGGPSSVFNSDYLISSPVGLDLRLQAGGEPIEPALLFAARPLLIKSGNIYDAARALVTRDPDKVVAVYPSKYLSLILTPRESEMSNEGIVLKADFAVTKRDEDETAEERAAFEKFKSDLAAQVKKTECSKDVSASVTAAGIRIVDLVRVAKAAQRNLKGGLDVSQNVLSALAAADPEASADNLKKAADIVVEESVGNVRDANAQLNDTMHSALEQAGVRGHAVEVLGGAADAAKELTDTATNAAGAVTGVAVQAGGDVAKGAGKVIEGAGDAIGDGLKKISPF